MKIFTQDDSLNVENQWLGPPSIEIGESSGYWNPTREMDLHTRIHSHVHFSSKLLDTCTFTHIKKLGHFKMK